MSAHPGCRACRRSRPRPELGRTSFTRLGLATGERGARLPEAADVAETRFVEGVEARASPGLGVEERHCLVDPHREHVADRAALEADLERLAIEPLAARKWFAANIQIGEESSSRSGASPGLRRPRPAAPLGVEAEPARRVAADLGLAGPREDLADLVVNPGMEVAVASSAGPRPIGLWSTSISLTIASRPSMALQAPGFGPSRSRCRRTARARTSWTRVLFPDPLTPVTHVQRPDRDHAGVDRLQVPRFDAPRTSDPAGTPPQAVACLCRTSGGLGVPEEPRRQRFARVASAAAGSRPLATIRPPSGRTGAGRARGRSTSRRRGWSPRRARPPLRCSPGRAGR